MKTVSENTVKKVRIVSLSRGILGEPFISHELELGLKRLMDFGLTIDFAENALKGMDFLNEHPELRAKDLIDAFNSDADMILCAVGGDDTYRLLPYLEKLKIDEKKIFLGFSDTTMNHFMLHKAGMKTFYGQAFLPDVCELAPDMLPYTKKYFLELIQTGTISEITPSDVWYDSREDFSPAALGTCPNSHINNGFELLQGPDYFEGPILGGCIDSIYDMFNNERHADSVELCTRYGLFPSLDDWKGRILLLETSEEKPSPEKYRKMIETLKNYGVFNVINGVLMGKPADETNFNEYKKILVDVINNPDLPILANINVGHATPRCIIPFGVNAKVSMNSISFV